MYFVVFCMKKKFALQILISALKAELFLCAKTCFCVSGVAGWVVEK